MTSNEAPRYRSFRVTRWRSWHLPLSEIRALILANVLLQVFDGGLTVRGLGVGFAEGNPLIARGIAALGPFNGVVVAKVLAVVFLMVIYRLVERSHRRGLILVAHGMAWAAAIYVLCAIVPWTLLLDAARR